MRGMTMGEAAERLSKADPGLTADYYARQIRGFAQRRLLGHLDHRGFGRTAAAILREPELCRARLLSEMVRLGMHPTHLAQATRLLNNVISAFPAGQKPPSHLRGFRGVLDGVRAGEDWFLVLKVAPWPGGDDPEVGDLSGGFYQALDLAEPHPTWRSMVIISCSQTLGPLLAGQEPGWDDEDDDDEDQVGDGVDDATEES